MKIINITADEAIILQGAIIESEFLQKRKLKLDLDGDVKKGRLKTEVANWIKNFSKIEFVGLCAIAAYNREDEEFLYCAKSIFEKVIGS